MLQLNSYVKYPASSSYHLTRLVFMKTSLPRTFTAVLTLATARCCTFATGGTFSNSRASLQFTATLANNTTCEKYERRRSSLKWVVQVQPDLTEICHAHEWQHRLFSRTHEHLLHGYVCPKANLVKSSEPNVDAGKEIKLPLNQNHLSCLFKWKVKLDSGAIPSTFLTLFRC